MLKASFIDSLTQPIVDIYEILNYRLLYTIVQDALNKRNATMQYGLTHYADLGMLSDDTAKLIRQAILTSRKRVPKLVKDAIKEALLTNGHGTEITASMASMIESLVNQAVSDLNLVGTVMQAGALDKATGLLKLMTDEQYRALSTGALEAASGARTMTQSIADTITDMSTSGIDAYVDRAGRHWSAEGYVSMDLRTTVHNAAIGAVKQQGEDLGLSVILVSSHAGARPLCAPYQGKCYSFNGTSGTIKDANGKTYHYEPIENTSYKKEPAGLFGINCKHSFRYIVDGAFINREQTVDTVKEEAENQKKYEAEQKARAIERKIRGYKQTASLVSLADEEKSKRFSVLASKWSKIYKRYCEDNNVHEMPDRLRLLGVKNV